MVIDGPMVVGGRNFYVLLTADQQETMLPESDITVWETNRSSPASWLVERPLVDPYDLGRALTYLKMSSDLTNLVYSFSAARTLFRPHQFKPVLKVIESPVHRLLLADEVGLGKTIEAGLIWTELDARSPLSRVLIVTPSGLLAKWQMEMERRFDREVQVLTTNDFLDFADRYAERGAAARLTGIISYPQLRNPRVIDMLRTRPPTLDLAIFDEAHALRNPSTKTHQSGGLVAQNAEAVVFLSATPVNLGSDDLFHLLHLLRPDEFARKDLFRVEIEPNAHVNAAQRALLAEFPPLNDIVLEVLRGVESTAQRDAFLGNPIYRNLVERLERSEVSTRAQVVEAQEDLTRLNTLADVYTRTRKRDLRDHSVVRRAHNLKVAFSTQEEALHEATLELVAALRRRSTGSASGLAAVMPARQASSCLPAMRSYLVDLAERGSIHLDLSEGEEEDELDETPEVELEIDDALEALAWEVADRWRDLGNHDSKLEVLLGALDELGQDDHRPRVLVFSFFRLTLAYLAEQLEARGLRCAQMHGGVPLRDRTALLRSFRAGELDVLLCSEVGSEGLDFEFCDVLVNYDLPWNPMRLEQRIGRLDRFGQRHEVIHILNFEIDGTIDTDIFLRLYNRIRVFEQSIGELEPILGPTVAEITRTLAARDLTPDEQRALADRIALAVESEQQNLERFNERQDELISADSFIEDSLADARNANRYLTPFELSRFVGGYLRDHAHPSRLSPVRSAHGLFELRGSPLLADRLRELSRPFATSGFDATIINLEANGSLTVTFDAELAYDVDATFLSHRHPLVRAIVEHYRSPDQQIHPGGYVRMPAATDEQVGRWVFYVFALSATGLQPRRQLVATAARLDTSEVDPEVGQQVLSWLSGPDVRRLDPDDIPLFDRDRAIDCYQSVLEYVVQEVDETKQRLSERNTALVAVRQASLQRELEVRRARLEEMATRSGLDDRIRRMREGEIRNLESKIRSEMARLEQQRGVVVDFRVVLGGVADLVSVRRTGEGSE